MRAAVARARVGECCSARFHAHCFAGCGQPSLGDQDASAATPGNLFGAAEVSYRWVEHTGELEMDIEAGTAEAVFADALHALAELLADEIGGERVWRDVTIDGHERAALLVGWLDELVYLAETEDLVPEDTGRIDLSNRGLVATVRCHHGRPRHLIKAATYHRLTFERHGAGFHATVVLDV
jgi:SHS2 domain-containing protein